MKFKIHCSGDSLIVEGETIEECRKEADVETNKRGWRREDCWSEEIK